MKILSEIWSYVLYCIYPDKCVFCKRTVKKGNYLCRACAENAEAFEREKRCIKCGMVKERCRCKKRLYRFNGVISPFYNEGLAKMGFYRYKFSFCENLSDFFALKMAESVKAEYKNIRFDAVCSVPPSRKRMRKFGYNPAEQLGIKAAEYINVFYVEDALGCRNVSSNQHNKSYDERFKMIRDCYFPKKSMRNKTVLLVDDICTTGATLDECARQLLKAGADEVWCVTALITDNKYKINSRYTTEILRQNGIAVK